MAHDRDVLREMEELMADSNALSLDELSARYEELLMTAMEFVATPEQNADVLLHALGLLERYMNPGERQETLEVIEEHRGERTSLTAPVRLFGRYIRSYAVEYLASQSYFGPHSLELKLRSHA